MIPPLRAADRAALRSGWQNEWTWRKRDSPVVSRKGLRLAPGLGSAPWLPRSLRPGATDGTQTPRCVAGFARREPATPVGMTS